MVFHLIISLLSFIAYMHELRKTTISKNKNKNKNKIFTSFYFILFFNINFVIRNKSKMNSRNFKILASRFVASVFKTGHSGGNAIPSPQGSRATSTVWVTCHLLWCLQLLIYARESACSNGTIPSPQMLS